MADAIDERWWLARKGDAHKYTLLFVQRCEDELSPIFERIFRLECLYDPNNPEASSGAQDRVTENAIASNVDTISAIVASVDIRARFMTDGGDWHQQQRARELEYYAEEMSTRFGVLQKDRRAFKESVKKGNGLVKVHNVLGKPRVEHILVENVVVPPDETRDGRESTQLHQWDYVDADELAMRFPKQAEQIEKARRTSGRRRASYGSFRTANDVECLWSWRLPIGEMPKKYDPRKKYDTYRPGRVTLVIEGVTLFDEQYHKPHFPMACGVWTERVHSWYGIGGAERIMGIQRALNKRNWTIEQALERTAMPLVLVRPVDAGLAAKANRAGMVATYRGDVPVTHTPPTVNAETFQSRIQLKQSAQEEFGQTSMVTHGAKPPGLDSGAALREFTDHTSQRWGAQELMFEQDLFLKTIELLLECCKDLGDEAPTMTRKSRFGARKIKWADVDMGEVKVQMKAAANLNRTPAGRQQLVIEFAQAGIISTDQARKLMQHPDLERELSLYTAAIEVVESDIDEIARGRVVMPDPMSSLAIAEWRGQREYNQWLKDGAPEEKLEALRQYVVQAIWMGKLANQSGANADAAGMAVDPAAAAAGAAPMPGPDMPMPMGPDPMAAPPPAALAAQAMQLRAS